MSSPTNGHSAPRRARWNPLVALPAYARLVRAYPAYRNLWLSQVVSNAGDWFATIAVMGLLLDLTGSSFAVGLLWLCQMLPSFLAAPFAGIVADRLDRRRLMIGADVFRAILALGYLLVRTPETAWLAFAVTATLVAASPFFNAAKSATIPAIVPRDRLVLANALSSGTWGTMLAVGSAAGGAVAVLLGRDAAFLANSLSFLVSAALILPLTVPAAAGAVHPLRFGTDFREGLAYLRQAPLTRSFLLAKPVWALFGGSVSTLIAVLGGRVLAYGDGGIAVLYTARGIGVIVGTFLLGNVHRLSIPQLRRAIIAGMVVFATGMVGVAAAPSLGIAGGFLSGAVLGGSLVWTLSTVGVQVTAAPEFLGRAMAADEGLVTLSMALSNLAAGLLLEAVAPRSVTLLVAGCALGSALLWARVSAVAARAPATASSSPQAVTPAAPGN